MKKRLPGHEALEAYRVKRGLQVGELADLVGLSAPMVSLILSKKRDPSIDAALRIEEKTGVVMDNLAKARRRPQGERLSVEAG